MDNILYQYIFSKKAEAIKNVSASFKKTSIEPFERYPNATVLPTKKIYVNDVAYERKVVGSQGNYIE